MSRVIGGWAPSESRGLPGADAFECIHDTVALGHAPLQGFPAQGVVPPAPVITQPHQMR